MARGDDEFVEFARASSRRLLHAAYLLTGDRHQAEDAVQTVYTRVYAAWSRVRRHDAYAYAYARTVLVNHLTDGWRRPMRETVAEQVPERPFDGDIAERVARRRWVIEALSTLTARERSIIVLRHFFDLSESEVAAQLDITVGTVKSTNARALGKLRITGSLVADAPDADGRGIGDRGTANLDAPGRRPPGPRPSGRSAALRGVAR